MSYHVKIFEEFENDVNGILTYFSFDIDDNLLFMDTRIKLEHLVDDEWVDEYVSTAKFAQVRADPNWRYKGGDESFEEFRDWGPRGKNTFLHDFKKAVEEEKFGPSWNKFIECLVNGHIFSIITSRGHEPKNVRRAFYWLIYNYGLDNFRNLPIENVDKSKSFDDQMIENLLSYHELFGSEPDQVIDSYIELCPVYTISSVAFKKEFGHDTPMELAKKMALRDFNNKVKEYADQIGMRAKYGFSDDDPKFVKAAAEEFMDLKDKHKNIDYSVFDTGGDKKVKKFM